MPCNRSQQFSIKCSGGLPTHARLLEHDVDLHHVIGFLADYLAGDLSPVERATFDAHLAECPNCRKYLYSYEQAIRVGQAAMRNSENDTNNPLPEALIAAILAARPQKHGTR